ncbi:MAG: hypothetical protein KGY38_00830 [Desulfobacterales bacterium]|nr:hypothetical protein [Desulfobacterales bacterium]
MESNSRQTMMPGNPTIGLIIATYIEAKPFVEGIKWHQRANAPFPVYQGRDLSLVISGMGKANAAAACAWLCTAMAPSCIVNLGSAGANRDGMPPGTIYHIKEALETDRRHFGTGEPFRYVPCVLEGFSTARTATRDEPVIDPLERRMALSFAELSDMEGAALIQAARKFQTPCLLFKFVSDTPGHTTGDEIPGLIRRHRDGLFEFFTASLLPRLKRDFAQQPGS